MGKKITMQTTYGELASKFNNPSKDYLMISELIDNSIGSWLESKLCDKENLKIEITLDMENKKISILDNAFGMSQKQLEDSVKLNKEKSGNVLNMFGVGMKNAAFWYGLDLTIMSNQSGKTLFTEVAISKVKDRSYPVEWEVNPSKHSIQRGTHVIISAVHEQRLFTQSSVDDLIKILQSKYQKYLDNSKNHFVIINLKYRLPGRDESDSILLKAATTNAQIIPKNAKLKAIEAIKKEYKNEKQKFLKNIMNIAIEKIENDEPMYFSFEVNLEGTLAPRGKKAILYIGIQQEARSFDSLYGLATYQKDRAINFAPENALELGEKIRSNIKRVFGSIELGEIFRPDNNKSGFNYGGYKEDFEDFLSQIGKEILPLADAMFSLFSNRRNAKAGNTKVQKEKVENLVQNKMAKNVKFYTSESGGEFIFETEKEDFTFVIIEKSIDATDNKNYFINTEQDSSADNKWRIYFNVNHPVWKPLMTSSQEGGANKIDVKTVIYPLVAMIGISDIAVMKKNLSFMDIDKYEIDSFSEALTEISRKAFEKQ